MRTVSPEIAAILSDAGSKGLVVSDMVVFFVKDIVGNPFRFGFWTEHDIENGNVINPLTGTPMNLDFAGGGTILSVGETPRTSDLSIKRKTVVMSGIHPAVRNMYMNYDIRLAQVAVYQALYYPETRVMVEALLEFVGELNGAPKEVPQAGGESGIQFDFVSDSRQLTRVNHAKRSDAHQRTRAGDGFHRYIGVAGEWVIPFGQESA